VICLTTIQSLVAGMFWSLKQDRVQDMPGRYNFVVMAVNEESLHHLNDTGFE